MIPGQQAYCNLPRAPGWVRVDVKHHLRYDAAEDEALGRQKSDVIRDRRD